jgi:hypothetical protein
VRRNGEFLPKPLRFPELEELQVSAAPELPQGRALPLGPVSLIAIR